MPTLFTKIIQREIPAEIVHRDDRVTAFREISPQAPVHILIVTNEEIPSINQIEEKDEALVGHMFTVARKVARQEGIADDGYRILVNCGKHGGQEVHHLHLHLVGGRPLGPMLVRE
jgi:histidine triad (HIT) family protein